MKFGAIPTRLTERLALALGKVPVPLLDAIYGPIKARALMAGVRLGVFEALREGWHAPEDLARRLGLDAASLELLLRVLCVADYVVHRRGRYALSPLGRRTMLPGGAMELRGFVRWNEVQLRLVDRLEDVLRTGRGLDLHAVLDDPEAWRDYERGMLEIARLDAPVVAKAVPVPRDATRLLDLGGGHGFFGAAVCRRHAGLRSTVLDLPAALDAARELARESGIMPLVDYRACDIARDDLGEGFDVALLCNILHHFAPPDVAGILRRTRVALRAGGTVAVWEIERPRSDASPTDGDGAALYFRLTSTGGAYPADEYAGWLRAAGFEGTRVRRPLATPGKILVTAHIPAARS